jgi:hypothetical protein
MPFLQVYKRCWDPIPRPMAYVYLSQVMNSGITIISVRYPFIFLINTTCITRNSDAGCMVFIVGACRIYAL